MSFQGTKQFGAVYSGCHKLRSWEETNSASSMHVYVIREPLSHISLSYISLMFIHLISRCGVSLRDRNCSECI